MTSTTKLPATLAKIVSDGRKRASRRDSIMPAPTLPAAPVRAEQLPLWNESYRGVPNAIIRSALFTVRNPNQKRPYVKERAVFALSNITIRYTGEELRQDDASVFMQILHIARTEPLGNTVNFTAGAFIRALGWDRAGESYERLKNAILRLTATAVHIHVHNERAGYAASLIRSFEYRAQDGEPLKQWRIQLEPAMKALFGETAYTRVLLQQRLKLKRSWLAQWLHLYYSSHREPYPQSVDSLRKLCGSDTKALYHFREGLMRALDTLKNVGFLNDWSLTKDDKVVVSRARLTDEVVALVA